jgi:arsenate reductase-like glutaredoxin family protein
MATTILIYGRDDSQSTRAALRFFKERRLTVQYHDVRRRPLAAGELQRFVARLGASAIVDTEGAVWKDEGLGWLRMDAGELVERLLADQRLIKLPLVRAATLLAAGRDEDAWREIAKAAAPPR